jgi:hypothetical protein
MASASETYDTGDFVGSANVAEFFRNFELIMRLRRKTRPDEAEPHAASCVGAFCLAKTLIGNIIISRPAN